MQNPELWERLEAFEFDAKDGSEPFSVKLASAEGWSPEFTAVAVEEYRKFLYLTQVSDGQATPSEAIDRVWHMHLTFTRHYWDALCRDVLQAELHHDPCKGAEHMPRYEAQFRATTALYVTEFGKDPDPLIWDGDTREKPRSDRVWRLALLGLGAVLAAGSLPGLRAGAAGLATFGLMLAILIVLLGLVPIRRRSRSGKGRGGGVAGCGSKGDGGGSGCGGGGCGGGG